MESVPLTDERDTATAGLPRKPKRAGLLAALRRRQPGRPIYRILWWHLLHFLCFIYFIPFYRYRAWGIHNIPDEGPVLFVSNHQSFLDPIIVGLGAHKRQFYAMARSTLWTNKVLAFLISSLNAVPVERGESDIKAMRKCLDVLAAGHGLLIFPEGTRTLDGTTGAFETGTMLLIKRSGATVVPVAIEGAFEVWPKGRKLPHPTGQIRCRYGEPIEAQKLVAMGGKRAIEHLQATVEAMRLELSGTRAP